MEKYRFIYSIVDGHGKVKMEVTTLDAPDMIKAQARVEPYVEMRLANHYKTDMIFVDWGSDNRVYGYTGNPDKKLDRKIPVFFGQIHTYDEIAVELDEPESEKEIDALKKSDVPSV